MYSIHKKSSLLLVLFILLFSLESKAQMFSVGNVQQDAAPDTPLNAVHVFYDLTDFTYFGPGFSSAPAFNYDFSEPLFRIQYENPLLNIFATFGRNLGPDENVNFTQVGIAIFGMYTFSRAENYRVYMPITLNTDYTLVRTQETQNTASEFAQNSAYIGAGLGLQTRFTNRLRMDLKALPHLGYTSGSFGATGGSSWKVNLSGRFYVDNIYSGFGLSLGYDFRFIKYNNSEESLRYDLQSNGFTVGITF